MSGRLEGKTVAILATDGFEQVELTETRKALEQAGARTEVVSPKAGEIQGFQHLDKGQKVKVDRSDPAAQLRAGVSQLSQALSRAALKPGDIVVRDGAPVQSASAPAGHFLDRAL